MGFVIGALVLYFLVTFTIIISTCILSSQLSRAEEARERVRHE